MRPQRVDALALDLLEPGQGTEEVELELGDVVGEAGELPAPAASSETSRIRSHGPGWSALMLCGGGSSARGAGGSARARPRPRHIGGIRNA